MSASRKQPTNPPNPYEVLGCHKTASKQKFHKANNPQPTADTRNGSYQRFAQEMPFKEEVQKPSQVPVEKTPAKNTSRAHDEVAAEFIVTPSNPVETRHHHVKMGDHS